MATTQLKKLLVAVKTNFAVASRELELHLLESPDQIVQRGTYAIFLVMPVAGLPDADSEAFLADGLVQAGLDWLAPLVSHVSGHLRRHRQLGKLQVLSGDLHAVTDFGLASEGRTGQLNLAAGRLRSLLSVIWLFSGGMGDLEWRNAQVPVLFVGKQLVGEAQRSCRLVIYDNTLAFLSRCEV